MRPLTKIDMVPDWIREALLDTAPEAIDGAPAAAPAPSSQALKAVKREFVLPTMGDKDFSKNVVAELFEDVPSATAVVKVRNAQAASEDQGLIYEKRFPNVLEAHTAWKDIIDNLTKFSSYEKSEVVPDNVKKEAMAYISNLRSQSDIRPTGSSSRTMSELAPGWTIVSSQDHLLVSFSDEFLKKALHKFKNVDDAPAEVVEQVYSTATRQHIGADNFVVSHWKKVKTEDGNIVRNAALISRLGGESYFVSGVSVDDYNSLCSYLTPNPVDYGIVYDSVTSAWYQGNADVKSNLKGLVAMVVERISGSPEEIAEYDKLKGKGKAAPELDLSEPAGDKPSEKESLPLGEEATAPTSEALGEAPTEEKSSEQDLMDLLKKEATKDTEEK